MKCYSCGKELGSPYYETEDEKIKCCTFVCLDKAVGAHLTIPTVLSTKEINHTTDGYLMSESLKTKDEPICHMTEREALRIIEELKPKFKRGDRVYKKQGSEWIGVVVGEYSTDLTPEGYCVESRYHRGSVQIYPAAALEFVED